MTVHKLLDALDEKGIIHSRAKSHWKARLIVGLILLALSALGVLITALEPTLAWKYWVYIIPVFAVICIWLTWLVSRQNNIAGSSVWQEILHWVGLLLAVYVVSLIIHSGIISHLVGGVFVLTLLALTMFLAGVHFDAMYYVIGIILGVLAILATLLVKYLLFILIPIIVLVGLVFLWRFRYQQKQSAQAEAEDALYRQERRREREDKDHRLGGPDDEL